MAAARDQAARIIRAESETAEDEAAPEVSAQLADQLRTHVAEETRRRPAEPHGSRAGRRAGRRPPMRPRAKSGKRKFVMMGVVGLLALAAVGYGVYFILVGRFYVSTDDAYVRANNTMLGARVAGHVAAILPARQFDRSHRRRDLQDRRRRLPDRGGRRAHQDRDPAGHHRPHRPPGHRAGKRGRAGQGATRLRGSRR